MIVPVHPHARGEHARRAISVRLLNGSSPRTWGTRGTHHQGLLLDRFIPTHVGNTCASSRGRRSGPVHPHARGEHLSTCQPVPGCDGSSPRTWGTPGQALHRLAPRRFIPTHVGNTDGGAASTPARAVHPHARGEHNESRGMAAGLSGSSPRTWGTRSRRRSSDSSRRFIPTHVGNTMIAVLSMMSLCGSSPRAWGTRNSGNR